MNTKLEECKAELELFAKDFAHANEEIMFNLMRTRVMAQFPELAELGFFIKWDEEAKQHVYQHITSSFESYLKNACLAFKEEIFSKKWEAYVEADKKWHTALREEGSAVEEKLV